MCGRRWRTSPGRPTASFDVLQEIQPFTREPSGVGFDVPAWLEALEAEIFGSRSGGAEEDETGNPWPGSPLVRLPLKRSRSRLRNGTKSAVRELRYCLGFRTRPMNKMLSCLVLPDQEQERMIGSKDRRFHQLLFVRLHYFCLGGCRRFGPFLGKSSAESVGEMGGEVTVQTCVC